MRYPSNRRKCEYINGDLYLVHARYQEERVKDPQLIKEWLGVDYVFKSHRDHTFIFCEKIEEIPFTEIK